MPFETKLFKFQKIFAFQNVSNLWNEHHENLKLCQKDGVVPVSALATDVLTENVFIITEDHYRVQVKINLIILN